MRTLEIGWTFAKYIFLFWLFTSLRGKTLGERVRMTLEDLGLTFVKAGQILATSRFFSGSVQMELERLYDNTRPLAFEVTKQVIEEELGMEAGNYFRFLNPEPLASASVAQTHEAVLLNGEKVVVKVRRPGVAESVRKDVRIARNGIFLLSLISRKVRSFRSARVPYHLRKWLLQETDFRIEADNMRRFAEAYDETPVVTARVIHATEALLIQEFLEGVTLNNWSEDMETETLSAKKSLTAFLEAMFTPLFADEKAQPFHCDPHPANLIVMEGGRVGAIDLGLMGKIDQYTLTSMNDAIFAIYVRDVDGTVDAMLRLCNARLSKKKEDAFRREAKEYVRQAASRPFAYWLIEMTRMLVHNSLPIPECINQVGRFGIIADGVVQRLFPGSSTEQLLGKEMRAGIMRRAVNGLAFNPLPVLWALSKAVGQAPYATAGFVGDPLKSIARWTEEIGRAWRNAA